MGWAVGAYYAVQPCAHLKRYHQLRFARQQPAHVCGRIIRHAIDHAIKNLVNHAAEHVIKHAIKHAFVRCYVYHRTCY